MPTKKTAPEVSKEQPDPDGDKLVSGPHDLSDHPALETGTIKNVGESVSDDPDAPSFRRPDVIQQSEGERKTTTRDPSKKTTGSRKQGDGAGPEN
jgi:hypothetical protein